MTNSTLCMKSTLFNTNAKLRLTHGKCINKVTQVKRTSLNVRFTYENNICETGVLYLVHVRLQLYQILGNMRFKNTVNVEIFALE